ncbi:MAG: DUF4405 domain-containing protein [Acidobacteria bacterium]|nr:MAG: DUF4405 domain-containing protein [Acidobacteriota bacterium]
MGLGLQPVRSRRFVTNLLLLSFLVSAVSGVVLFFRPEGSLARWVGWSVFGLDKKRWEAVHLVFVAAFLLASIAHIAYNWRPLIAHLRERAAALGSARPMLRPSRELLAAVAVIGAVFAGTLAEWQPLAAVVSLRTAMKDGAFVTTTPPPMPDADRVTVTELCGRTGLAEAQAIANARANGIEISSTSMTLAAGARAHARSPEAVYRAILGQQDGRIARP